VPIIGIDWNDEDAAAIAWLSQLGNPYEVVATDHNGRAASTGACTGRRRVSW